MPGANRRRVIGGVGGPGNRASVVGNRKWLGGSLRTQRALTVLLVFDQAWAVPRGERLQAFDMLWVEGPMARSVEDAALMLDAGCGATS